MKRTYRINKPDVFRNENATTVRKDNHRRNYNDDDDDGVNERGREVIILHENVSSLFEAYTEGGRNFLI